MNQYLKYVSSLVISILLFGCAQKLESMSADSDQKLEENIGYLLLGIDTNTDLHSITIGGENYLKLTQNDLRHGSKYILVDIPSGKYKINDIRFAKRIYMKLIDGYWDFEVKPGEVNYIGDIHVDAQSNGFRALDISATLFLQNRSTAALNYLKTSFPKVFDSKNVRYVGPGNDDFLEYAESLAKEKDNTQ
ncbi:hypothetical protein [Shewanella gelidii]|uniref:Uncharacterized protein n=1 Tax=Shewanella gelidii TaxID=1642821 RepID=A0A917JMA8_9GAMM|nr:hypothetical protein [Shewanella gelidii]MCL1099226.1 hypothetical protein [Shewanella gelidii]GGI76604.1 hypothetical protein GCM10009332_12440 [Shewanella gelidii]